VTCNLLAKSNMLFTIEITTLRGGKLYNRCLGEGEGGKSDYTICSSERAREGRGEVAEWRRRSADLM